MNLPDLRYFMWKKKCDSIYFIKKKNPKIFTIHIQNPKVDLKNFDIIVAPEHDSLNGE